MASCERVVRLSRKGKDRAVALLASKKCIMEGAVRPQSSLLIDVLVAGNFPWELGTGQAIVSQILRGQRFTHLLLVGGLAFPFARLLQVGVQKGSLA